MNNNELNFLILWDDLYNEIGEFITKNEPKDDWDYGYRSAYRDILDLMDSIIYKEKHKNDNN